MNADDNILDSRRPIETIDPNLIKDTMIFDEALKDK